ncbi:MAG: hypothetical protein GY926_14105 [bacterium]|nr:hypothetical protein [bacterium]MCP4966352.1 hypothetical protein [bacterium]
MLVSLAVATVVLLWNGAGGLRPRQVHRPVDEVQLLSAIHAELRAGASLRLALANATRSVDDPAIRDVSHIALSGAPVADLAHHLGRLPSNGVRLAAALRMAEQVGGRSADTFARLTDRAIEEADLAREKRALTTQARLSAVIVGCLPVLWFLFGGVERVGGLVAAGGPGLAVAVVGVAMEITGGVLVWRLAAT